MADRNQSTTADTTEKEIFLVHFAYNLTLQVVRVINRIRIGATSLPFTSPPFSPIRSQAPRWRKPDGSLRCPEQWRIQQPRLWARATGDFCRRNGELNLGRESSLSGTAEVRPPPRARPVAFAPEASLEHLGAPGLRSKRTGGSSSERYLSQHLHRSVVRRRRIRRAPFPGHRKEYGRPAAPEPCPKFPEPQISESQILLTQGRCLIESGTKRSGHGRSQPGDGQNGTGDQEGEIDGR